MKTKAHAQKKSLKEISTRTLEATSGGLTLHLCCGPGLACEGFYGGSSDRRDSNAPDWTDGSTNY